jgi:hypothetical protein
VANLILMDLIRAIIIKDTVMMDMVTATEVVPMEIIVKVALMSRRKPGKRNLR